MEKERKKTIGEWNHISTWRRKGERRRGIFGQQRRRRPKKEKGVRALQYDQLLWENAIPAGVTTFSSTLEKCINIHLIIIVIIIIIIIIIITIICDNFTSAPFPNPPYVRLNLRMSTKSPPFPKSYIRTFDFMLSKDSLYWLTSCRCQRSVIKILWNNFCYDVYWQGNTGIGLAFDENLGWWARQILGF